MTRIVIHIGAGKCGSSAIQHYLSTQAIELRGSGVLVPDEDLGTDRAPSGEQIWFFKRLREMDPAASRTLWREKCRHLLAVAAEEGLETVIISAENLINPTGTALLLEAIDVDVKIVAYVRRQLDFLVSAWQQWHLKRFSSTGSYLDEHLGVTGNWNLCLADWESAFGRENIDVRRYGREMLHGGDVVADFMQALKLPMALPMTQTQLVNTSYSDAVTAIAMRCPEQFKAVHDNDFYVALASLVGDLAWRDRPTSFPFSAVEVDVIEQAYAAGNEALRKKFFPDLEAPLFPAAADDDISPPDPDDLRTMTNELLDRAILGISTAESFDYAHPAEFTALLESLRDSR